MTNAQRKYLLTEAEYLASEELATMRHEFVGGEVHAMAGAGERHNIVAGNIYLKLRNAARTNHCRAFMADMKLRQSEGSVYYYPDVMLVCDAADDNPMHKLSPCFIAEVLSPATSKIDQREKLQAYMAIPSLRYYLVADSDRVWAKYYSRDTDGRWLEQELGTENDIDIRCGEAHCILTLDDIYDETDLPVR